MASDRAGVDQALAAVLAQVPPAEFRLVGTASSVLRGIVLPAADIDILFRDRADVDAWFDTLSIGFEVETAAAWIPDASQYFARLHTHGIPIELSTVEIATDRETMECSGTGPWEHFDLITCGTGTVPAVASELRLLTEVARGRTDRSQPIAAHLRVMGCDRALIERGLADIGVSPPEVERVLADVSGPRFGG